ncbi:Antitoxin [Planktothrix tepida]|uniref:Uncharacterized protein n=1 Tax=Planktothrix tepida PCC 9214 TaxID=671072 RepID=A0A1J1LUP7_9CYAN|nr:hypothetical protein [Planktothrix tepida]CAD5982140.1 Antitoxin [Planktothrix tepida]CUR35746.1 conserved hypothetical protein [Planktothrix tepida PCC 9214]
MPIKIRLMTDYGCYPLWWDEPDQVGDLEPESLPLSQETIQRLYHWADAFETRLNLADPSDSPEVTPEEIERFEWEGLSLWKQLDQELAPDYEVVYFSSNFHQIFTNPVKLEEKLKLNLMKFNQISWEDARENITQLCEQVVANRDIIVIHRPEGESVVLMAIEELNHLITTAH